MQEMPSPPAGLRAPGKRLWADVVSRYELGAGELEILRQAAHTADETDRLERAVRKLPDFTVAGSMGQPRMHPLLGELRHHRLLLRRLVDSMCLPDELEAVGLRPGQRHAQTAANARWSEQNPRHARAV
jgi:hypothetical protein